MARLSGISAALLALALTGALAAQRPAGSAPSFDYYVVSLSWAPEFCAQPHEAVANPLECGAAKPMEFVLHGLWPEAARGRSPESCGPSKKVSKGLIDELLPYVPSASLIQHEWDTHGSCTGLSQRDYFEKAMLARAAVQVPVQISSVEETSIEGVRQIEEQFAAANPGFPAAAFRVACRNGALTEVRACLDKDLHGRACTASVADCGSATVKIRARR